MDSRKHQSDSSSKDNGEMAGDEGAGRGGTWRATELERKRTAGVAAPSAGPAHLATAKSGRTVPALVAGCLGDVNNSP